jgi:polyphosphate:AMP phosphotransferase
MNASDPNAPLRTELETCGVEIGRLQRAAQAAKIPLVVALEGWEAAGKGTLINGLTLALDSRGFRVVSILPAAEQEPWYPPLHRFWATLPEAGRITIYDRSWYTDLWSGRALKRIKRRDLGAALSELHAFEKTLLENGVLIVKFFLHIDQQEQAKRLRKLQKDEFARWRVDKESLEQNRNFERWEKVAREVLLTGESAKICPFVVCPAHDKYATLRLALRTLNGALSERLSLAREPAAESAPSGAETTHSRVTSPLPSQTLAPTELPLSRVDLTQKLTREEYDQQIRQLQARLRELEYRIYTRRIGVIIGCEGWDASGKGGNIRRLVSGLDPRGYDVHPIAAPNDVERSHHYLWRFWNRVPKAGHIAIFDRTWYGRVLVERIEGFCTEGEWRRAYHEIAEFEQALADSGLVLIKFWFHIDADTQLARFRDRQNQPDKQWKITEEDWRNRDKWSEYEAAVNDMLTFNSSEQCPYWVVPANDKLFARVFTLRRVVESVEQALNQRANC